MTLRCGRGIHIKLERKLKIDTIKRYQTTKQEKINFTWQYTTIFTTLIFKNKHKIKVLISVFCLSLYILTYTNKTSMIYIYIPFIWRVCNKYQIATTPLLIIPNMDNTMTTNGTEATIILLSLIELKELCSGKRCFLLIICISLQLSICSCLPSRRKKTRYIFF